MVLHIGQMYRAKRWTVAKVGGACATSPLILQLIVIKQEVSSPYYYQVYHTCMLFFSFLQCFPCTPHLIRSVQYALVCTRTVVASEKNLRLDPNNN